MSVRQTVPPICQHEEGTFLCETKAFINWEDERTFLLSDTWFVYGYGIYPGGKERPGRDADPLPPSRAAVMEE